MKTPCCIIKDVLPLYAEGLASEGTCALVGEHLAECEDCSNEYESIRTGAASAAEVAEDAASEARFIRNVKKKLGLWTVLYVAAAALLTVLLGCQGSCDGQGSI